ncbi:multidrug DMT transporter permease [Salipiger aestuarii]|uniref:Drug/metabolite transporter (DMT)-like permease n=1 Tax=Salipiger aestuarii TaxID=568098 RepID=A0A327YPX5_9RHOB|nr:DMT family transporter [Salipiger aestuarii]EIE50679.1 integral membrane protein, putative [Citreicella sp. 357]KAA8607315.1 multidrug DMT transporter permease [Salipiger aestuarii]KAA8612992.1 multidrug DMT transporter permease [Salipiger aestuarii]KAB2543771.1 multidrug DMT transporter permease [Salipiger aestuarii]RAK23023.1 drug/metabolite transporter (DMT)-like permease [Salipiger aestuarii]
MSPTFQAVLWMGGSVVSFTAMAVAGRAVSLDLDTFEIMFYRSVIGFIVVVTLLVLTGTRGQVTHRRLGLHTLRNLSHFTGQNLWFYAVATIPLAQVFALEFTSPLWVILISPLVLGERITATRAFAAAIGFIGILVVARPSPETLSPGLFAAAGAAMGFAGSAVFTRRLTRTETTVCILFWLTLMQAAFGLICAGFDGDIALPSPQSWPFVAVIALAGLIAHFCLTTALRLAPATVVIPIDFTRLPIAALLGIALYREPLDPYVFLGAAIIFGANYVNILKETRNPSRASTQ